jgi:hypothetical protein
VIDFVNRWAKRTELERKKFIAWLGVASSTFYSWAERYGKVNEHNRLVPRDHWLEDHEKQAVLDYERRYPLEGYRRLAFMMLDDDVAAASPSAVYRVLKDAGRLDAAPAAPNKKGTGFQQPLQPHEHWHTNVSYLNIAGTFYYLISVLDARRLQPHHRALGHPRVHDRVRRGNRAGTGPTVLSQRTSARHHRQRAAVHRTRFQGVHSPRRHDARAHVAILPTVQRQKGTLVRHAETRMHSAAPCPLHDTPQSRSQCCSINLHKNLFQCFDPQCRSAGNVLDFWAALQKLPLPAAARQLRDRFAPHLATPTTEPEKRQPVVSPCLLNRPAYDATVNQQP